jgi:Putative zinc-finger
MTCDPQLVSYYRDGALAPEERYELERHLRGCDECTARLRGLMRLAQVVRSLPMEPVSPSLRDDVMRLVAVREQSRRQPIHLVGIGRALAPAAVAAAIAVTALIAFRPGALDLTNRAADAPVEVTAPAPAASSTSARGSGSLSSRPPLQAVSESNTGSLPIQIANPAVVPEPIARLYSTNQQIRDLLGAAAPGSRTVTLLEQSFQGGLAIWRSDTREIYVLRRDGNTWSVHTDTWRPGERVAVDGPPPPGALVPAGGFGSVWRSTPEIKSRLGWAVYEPRGSGGSIQTFEHGVVVWTPHGLLYVLSDDGRWRTFPDASPL